MPLASGKAERRLPRSTRFHAGIRTLSGVIPHVDADYSARPEVLGPRRVPVPVA